MLWRLMPALRQRFGYEDIARWVELYGVRQRIIKVDIPPGAAGGVRSKRKNETPRFKELPGISPLVLNLLLPHCLFLELADVAPDLPPYQEDVVTVPLGPILDGIYRPFERQSTDMLRAQLLAGDNSGTSSWFHALMIWPNLPCTEIIARAKRTGVELGRASALPADRIYPKEQALLDLVRRERAEGRRCLIYVEHTGEHDLLPRLKHLIEDDDARWQAEDPADHPGRAVQAVTLRGETVSTAKREGWLAQQVERGCDVLLCHSGLVEVGLDLLAFPTIIVYEVIFSTTRWRQAIRRSWRPGQTKPVRVVQLAYENTMEARGLQLIATKAISSLMVEGKMPSASLSAQAETSSTTNLIMELFEQVVNAAPQDTADSADTHAQYESEDTSTQGTRPARPAKPTLVQSVRDTFLELGRVEQEAESFIDAPEDPEDLEDQEDQEEQEEQEDRLADEVLDEAGLYDESSKASPESFDLMAAGDWAVTDPDAEPLMLFPVAGAPSRTRPDGAPDGVPDGVPDGADVPGVPGASVSQETTTSHSPVDTAGSQETRQIASPHIPIDTLGADNADNADNAGNARNSRSPDPGGPTNAPLLPPLPAAGNLQTVQHRYTWEELRAQLQQAAQQRKAARASRAQPGKGKASRSVSDVAPTDLFADLLAGQTATEGPPNQPNQPNQPNLSKTMESTALAEQLTWQNGRVVPVLTGQAPPAAGCQQSTAPGGVSTELEPPPTAPAAAQLTPISPTPPAHPTQRDSQAIEANQTNQVGVPRRARRTGKRRTAKKQPQGQQLTLFS